MALNAETLCANITAAVDNPMLTLSARNRITPIHNLIDRDLTLRTRQSFAIRIPLFAFGLTFGPDGLDGFLLVETVWAALLGVFAR